MIIKPHRIYIRNRIKNNFYNKVEEVNSIIKKSEYQKNQESFILSGINSYLGMTKHYNTYTLRKKILKDKLIRFKGLLIDEKFLKINFKKTLI